MPSYNETKIHVSTNLHVYRESRQGWRKKTENIYAALQKRTGLQPKNFFEKRGVTSYSVLGLSPGTMFLNLVHALHMAPIAMPKYLSMQVWYFS